MLKKDDAVRIRRLGGEEWVPGIVDLASPNGQSVIVVLASALLDHQGGMWANAIPLLVDYEKETVRDFCGGEYEIEVSGWQKRKR